MGFRYRKSINLGGGFRINLSKSGIGYSWGTKGYRITKTASGKTRRTYSIPGTGISYVDESGKRNSRRRGGSQGYGNSSGNNYNPGNYNPSSNYEAEIPIESASIEQFKAAETGNISQTIEKTIKLNKWSTALIWLSLLGFAQPVFFLLLVLGIVLKVMAHKSGRVDLEYSFDAEAKDEHDRKIGAWQLLAEGKKEWQITSEQFNSNTKLHAGAGRSLNRIPCQIEKGRPFYINTNIDTVQIKLKKEMLIILPDKVFIVRGSKVGMIDYSDFRVQTSEVRFVESEGVPKDAQVVGHTWQFVNKNGTPDRRYSNNRQLPICLYGQVFLRSSGGLNVEIQVSNVQNCRDFSELINA